MFYDWNVASDLWLVGLLAGLIDYWRTPVTWRIVLMSCLLTLAGWCRIPSFAAVVIVVAVVAMKLGWNARLWKALTIGFCTVILLSFLVLWLAFGDAGTFVDHFGDKYIVSGHNRLSQYLHVMWSYYLPLCYKTFVIGVLAIIVAWLAGQNGGAEVTVKRPWGVALLAIAWGCMLVRVVNPYDWVYGYVWAWVLFCLLAVVIAYSRSDSWHRMAAVTSLLFMVLPLIGTNVPLARFNVATYLPFLALGLLGRWRQWFSVALTLFGGGMVAWSVFYPLSKGCKERDATVGEASVTCCLPYLEGIALTPDQKTVYDTNYHALRGYAEDGGVLLLGHEKYLYGMALRGVNTPEPWPHRFESDNWADANDLHAEFHKVVPHYKYVAISELRPYRMVDVEAIYEPSLEKEGFELVEDTGYNCKIYRRK
ncbi:MAG: hypothetical protein LIP02_07030 [Bacteroidales bacterium]|nr:hypothetical protein [Bacteroidales bacterium]